MFEELLEQAYSELDEAEAYILEFVLRSSEPNDSETIALVREWLGEEDSFLAEEIVRRVNSKGIITRMQSRAVRSRRAVLTTGMSKAALRIRARKAARTKKRNPMIQRMALRRRRKALRRRKQFGIK